MFTGIIKALGKIADVKTRGVDARLSVVCESIAWQNMKTGDSISVNGVCLTAIALRADGFDADVSKETLEVTTLAKLERGSAVNLEPALCAGEPLGGHMVSGHVDGIATVSKREMSGRSIEIELELTSSLMRFVAPKGSICLDGVSLTVNSVSGNLFNVNIIPHTAAMTTIDQYRVGTNVNVEVDMLARYLERILNARDDASRAGGIDHEFLKEHGYG